MLRRLDLRGSGGAAAIDDAGVSERRLCVPAVDVISLFRVVECGLGGGGGGGVADGEDGWTRAIGFS